MNENMSTAEECGIEQGYHDVFGHWHGINPETLQRLVAALSCGQGAALQSAPKDGVEFERAFQGHGRRVWGIAVQLYALRSRRNWGHGDFGDLARLIEVSAAHGASAIGLNPLHALFPDRAWQASPYAPNSRLFLNPLYIDVEAISEFPGVEAAGVAADIAAARAPALIDYAAVARAKLTGLRAAYAGFASSSPSSPPSAKRRADFEAYRSEQGEMLLRFACFEVLRRQYEGTPWPQWPQPWCQPDGTTLRGYRDANTSECEFHEFTQWIADRQLRACKDAAHRHGMSIGLYADLAVGIDPLGADAWSQQDAVLAGLSVGAPPDEFNPAGQDWGLAPFNPRTMAIDDFEPMRRLMRATMRHAGAVRIDHVLGLNRMFLIPQGAGAANGAYVRYPLEDSLRVIAQESNQARCIVIGEDLGTVPDGFRDTLARWGLWSYKVMLFEREHGGRFRAPENYPAEALATFNTHDLPSFRGWMTNHDLRLKRSIGIDPGENDEGRHFAREALQSLLRERTHDYNPDDFAAVAAILAQTPSRLVMVALDDILDGIEQINIPGTVDQHPNWRRKLPVDVEDLTSHEGLQRIAGAFAHAGRNQS